jgi:hypothetical protein
MSWLSDVGGTLGSMGSVLGAFVPGVGQAIAGVGGLLAMTDDPDALILFPEYPFEPGGMAYGISRTRPGGDERGIYLGASSWTNGPSYQAEGGIGASYGSEALWSHFIIGLGPSHGIPQPMGSGLGQGSAIRGINPVFGAQGVLSSSQQVFGISQSYWAGGDGAVSSATPSGGFVSSFGGMSDLGGTQTSRQFREEITLVYGALWGLDLETMTRNPLGPGPRRLFVRDDNSNRTHVITAPEFVQIERGPLQDIVLAVRGADAAEFWRDEWLSATAPVLDSSVADIRGWDENGGGAVQTWMQSAPLWNRNDSGGLVGPQNLAYDGLPSLASWTNLQTPEAEIAYTEWAAYQSVEAVKLQTAGAEWWSQKQQIEAQAAWDEYQAQAQGLYWEQFQASQAQSQAYLAHLTEYSNPYQGTPQGSMDESMEALVSAQPTTEEEPLTVGEEEAIGIGAAAAALLIL